MLVFNLSQGFFVLIESHLTGKERKSSSKRTLSPRPSSEDMSTSNLSIHQLLVNMDQMSPPLPHKPCIHHQRGHDAHKAYQHGNFEHAGFREYDRRSILTNIKDGLQRCFSSAEFPSHTWVDFLLSALLR